MRARLWAGLPFVLACAEATPASTIAVATVKDRPAVAPTPNSARVCRMVVTPNGEASSVVEITSTTNARGLPIEIRTKREKHESTFLFSYDRDDRLARHQTKETNDDGLVTDFDRTFVRKHNGRIERVDTEMHTNRGDAYRYSETVVARDAQRRWTRIESSDNAQDSNRVLDANGRVAELIIDLERSYLRTRFVYEGDAREPVEEHEDSGRKVRIDTIRDHQLATRRLEENVTTYAYEGNCPPRVDRLIGPPRLYLED